MTKKPNKAACVTPKYSSLAIMPTGEALQDAAYLKTTDIEKFVNFSPKYQTINRMLHGKPGNYAGVHRVFTAINAKMGGTVSRKDGVLTYDDGTKTGLADANLDKCLVFPKLAEHLKSLSVSAARLGDEAEVATYQIEHMIEGLPVAENLVEAVFEVVNSKLGNKLRKETELFN
jgi:hypothetical protein